ncbi:unnamed protein product [Protopolystoma xenopodis]|uniref:Phosphatidic acid phosphatase type 2/haloperoxidase domain-containing protein n=1 Tax=Protopolystoma xenopodis TaxID=117903 RepID=A0A448WU87_9PLAT|nr:unnamed protein product [Protopolystoma xenopodis]
MILRVAVQFIMLSTAFYIGLSRVSDYKHHPSDVLAGFIVGTFSSVFLVRSDPLKMYHFIVTRTDSHLMHFGWSLLQLFGTTLFTLAFVPSR